MPYLAISIKISNAQTLLGIHPTDISPCCEMTPSGGHVDCSQSFCHNNQGCGEYSVQSDEFSQSKHTLFKKLKLLASHSHPLQSCPPHLLSLLLMSQISFPHLDEWNSTLCIPFFFPRYICENIIWFQFLS